jgi:hypothetical protein
MPSRLTPCLLRRRQRLACLSERRSTKTHRKPLHVVTHGSTAHVTRKCLWDGSRGWWVRRGWWECGCDGGLWGQGPWRAHGLMAHVTRTYLSNGARGKMGKEAMAEMTGGRTGSAVVTIVTCGGVGVRGQCWACGGRVENTAVQHVVGDDVECKSSKAIKAAPKSSKHRRDSKDLPKQDKVRAVQPCHVHKGHADTAAWWVGEGVRVRGWWLWPDLMHPFGPVACCQRRHHCCNL